MSKRLRVVESMRAYALGGENGSTIWQRAVDTINTDHNESQYARDGDGKFLKEVQLSKKCRTPVRHETARNLPANTLLRYTAISRG